MPAYQVNIPESDWKTIGTFTEEPFSCQISIQIGQDPTSKLWYTRETSETYGTIVNDSQPHDTEEEALREALQVLEECQGTPCPYP